MKYRIEWAHNYQWRHEEVGQMFNTIEEAQQHVEKHPAEWGNVKTRIVEVTEPRNAWAKVERDIFRAMFKVPQIRGQK